MSWASWQEFVAMGGQGAFVWGSFGVVAAALIAELWSLRRARVRLIGELQQLAAAAESELIETTSTHPTGASQPEAAQAGAAQP